MINQEEKIIMDLQVKKAEMALEVVKSFAGHSIRPDKIVPDSAGREVEEKKALLVNAACDHLLRFIEGKTIDVKAVK